MVWTPGFLSADTNGQGILVTTTSAPGTLIHTATSASGNLDKLNLYVSNLHSSDVLVTLTIGTRSRVAIIPGRTPAVLIGPGDRVAGGIEVRCFASLANMILLTGGRDTYSP